MEICQHEPLSALKVNFNVASVIELVLLSDRNYEDLETIEVDFSIGVDVGFRLNKETNNYDFIYHEKNWNKDLSIEEFFYLLFPLIVICFSPNNFISKIILIFISITVLKFFLNDSFDANFYRTGTFFRFDAILLGFILAHYKDQILHYKKTII